MIVWYPAPQAGDIVQCHFPQDKFPQPGPKSRPALVMQVDEFEVSGERQADVIVAYGSSKVKPLRPGHFVITSEQRLTGLPRDTRFDLTNQCALPYNDMWFTPAPASDSPVMGRLPLHIAAIKKSFVAALHAAQQPIDQTAPQPKLNRKK